MPHILIVDDNDTFLYAARELILRERRGFVVDTAADAEHALSAIRRHHPEHVLGVDSLWHSGATEQIHRRSETITQELLQAATCGDRDDKYMLTTWADQEAERIVTAFLDHQGSDDLLQLRDLIRQALCAAYETGKTRLATFNSASKSRKGEIHRDTGL